MKKINRTTCVENYPLFPWRWYDKRTDEVEHSYPKTYQSYTLTVQAKSWKGHMKLLGTSWQQLGHLLGYEFFVFLGDSAKPWHGEQNDYARVQEADQYLAMHKVGKRFNGGLQVNMAEVHDFIKHLAWMSRCNASLPDFHAIDNKQQILASICQYGNVHIYLLHSKVNARFKKALAATTFQEVKNGMCSNSYSKTGRIKSRKITL